jgi:hypothetical protein
VLVLRELALLDAVFPACAVSLLPLPAAIFGGHRAVVPGQGVALALVAAFAGLGLLAAFAAGREPQNQRQDQNRFHGAL